MTEEEKKAIKVLEKYKFSEREEYLENNAKKIGKKYEDLYLERTWIPTTYERKQFTIVYNLIEKLKKEIEEKDRRIKELETINENITRELLSRTEKLSEVLDKRYALVVPNGENLKQCLISVGRNIIKKADYIAQDDAKFITSVTINAELTPSEILSFNVTKNYLTNFEFKKEKTKDRYEQILKETDYAIDKMLNETEEE